ncbi:5'-nucleotidase C-terminal domain-containing protein [Frigidibacter sp. MR17.24]|uniref:5'-nucleotidase C-terminal domain-containing protein n=1 Tax=Frigidibacter sp. MR17.24 TaxID=3127345 RepID=UPI003012D2C5
MATARLTVMVTSDLHCEVSGWDYLRDRPSRSGGLHRLAPVIARLRAAEPNTLLLDNGDLLQGNLLADEAARLAGEAWNAPHPAIAALNALGYDAAGLGNHDFDYGLDRLDRALAAAAHPVTCANLRRSGAGALPRDIVLERRVLCDDGARRPLRIGVLGLLPPQTALWNRHHLHDRAEIGDIMAAARERLPALRARCDVVIALAHTGFGPQLAEPGMENAGHALAALPGIDLLALGHSHLPHVATTRDRAIVLPGPQGLQLGVARLALEWQGQAWQVTGRQAELLRGTKAPLPPETPAHRAAVALARRPVARLDRPVSTHFALVASSSALQIVARAQAGHVARALDGRPEARLPLVSAVAPFRSGGRYGPGHYALIPRGTVSYRHVADLYPFGNRLVALRVTGRDLRSWLEQAARIFRRLRPGVADQPLINADVPPWTFDTLFGLSYRIDLSQAACGAGGRILDLCHAGIPVEPDQPFVIATNSHRATTAPGEPIYVSRAPARDILVEEFARTGRLDAEPERAWQFAPVPGATALVDTAPEAAQDDRMLASLGAEVLGTTPAGFLRLRLPMHPPPRARP